MSQRFFYKVEKILNLRKYQSMKLLLVIVISWWVDLVHAGGLSSSFVELRADNLSLGETYNLTEQANYPICIINTSNFDVWLKIEPIIPDKSDLRAGYEPIPSTEWINIEPMIFNLKSNEQAIAHLTLTIPEDENYLGKRYQVGVLAHTMPPPNGGGVGIGYGLLGRLLFSISSKLHPSKLQVSPENIKPQRVLRLGNVYPISLQLKNTLSFPATCTISIHTPQQLNIPTQLPSSEIPYKQLPENTLNFIILSENTLFLPPNATQTTTLYVAFPLERKFIGDWYYVICLQLPKYNLQRYVPMHIRLR